MVSTYKLLKRQIIKLDVLTAHKTDLYEVLGEDITYLEGEIDKYYETDNEKFELYCDELETLKAPIYTVEEQIRVLKRSIIEDYSELILTTVGDVSLANSILSATKNVVKTDEIIEALNKKFFY